MAIVVNFLLLIKAKREGKSLAPSFFAAFDVAGSFASPGLCASFFK
jgi:hypothetical protein